MGDTRDTNHESIRRYRIARIDAWLRAGFLADEANQLSAAGIKLRSNLARRIIRERRRLIQEIRALGYTREEDLYRILDELYLNRPGDVWDFIATHYPIGATA